MIGLVIITMYRMESGLVTVTMMYLMEKLVTTMMDQSMKTIDFIDHHHTYYIQTIESLRLLGYFTDNSFLYKFINFISNISL